MESKDITKKQLATAFSFVCYGDRFALCGQPQEEDLKEFKTKSWTNVLNLRNQKELDSLDFEMSDLCQKLGLDYNHIPVIVNGDIDKEALKKIHDLFSDSNQEKRFVIHCASGTRSILALMAHFLFSNSHKRDELPSLAEALGLKQPQILARLLQVVEVGT